MIFYTSFLITMLAAAVICTNESPYVACSINNLECLGVTLQKFMSETCDGVKKYNMKQMDPLIVPSIDVVVDETSGVVINFKNANITGLRNQTILGFKLDPVQKSVSLKTKMDIAVVSDIDLKFTKSSKIFRGQYLASATAIATSTYNYSTKDIEGVTYFTVGPETNSCEINDDCTMSIKVETKDSDDEKELNACSWNNVTLRKKILRGVVDAVSVVFMQNIRALTELYPMATFFKDF